MTDKAYANKIIKKETANENKSIALFEIAKIKKDSDVNEALRLIEKAISMRKYFPPYIKLYLEILFKNNQLNKIQKVLKKYWNEIPSSALRLSITDILKENKVNEISFIKNIISKNQNSEESKKTFNRFCNLFKSMVFSSRTNKRINWFKSIKRNLFFYV